MPDLRDSTSAQEIVGQIHESLNRHEQSKFSDDRFAELRFAVEDLAKRLKETNNLDRWAIFGKLSHVTLWALGYPEATEG